ncbi:unnamed protein product, partial [Rotaria sp. Silwood1]
MGYEVKSSPRYVFLNFSGKRSSASTVSAVWGVGMDMGVGMGMGADV